MIKQQIRRAILVAEYRDLSANVNPNSFGVFKAKFVFKIRIKYFCSKLKPSNTLKEIAACSVSSVKIASTFESDGEGFYDEVPHS